MSVSISKSRFKAHALELFRKVEQTGEPIIITDHGTPVLKIMPYRDDPASALRVLRETVVNEGDVWRARGKGRQIAYMRKGELVRIPERFKGTF